mmetsp:Transcript_2028/g.4613  ORF Transcript_2028/g.4613 Transcript_2028/m.4613 type:complete len:1061 (-) Transcript_2028:540-3722(-)
MRPLCLSSEVGAGFSGCGRCKCLYKAPPYKMTEKVLLFSLLIVGTLSIETRSIPPFNNPPVSRQYPRGCYNSVNNILYMFGGFPESGSYYADIWQFDFGTQAWAEITSTSRLVPSERKGHACFLDEANSVFYLFGGESDLGILGDMWALSLKSYLWTEVEQGGDPPPAVASFAYSSYIENQKIKFAISRGITFETALEDVYIFDLETKKWTKAKGNGTQPKAERDSAMVYFEGAFWYFGGYKEEDNINPKLAESILYKYDIAGEKWATIQTTNTILNRHSFGLVAYNSKLYMFQGWSDAYDDQRTIYKLDLKASSFTWVEVEFTNDLYDPLTPYDSYAFDFKGSVAYFACGWNLSELKNNIATMDLKQAEPLTFKAVTYTFITPSARMFHQLVAVGTQLFMYGGQGRNSKLGDLWAFDTESLTWTRKQMIGDSPANRSGYSTCLVGDIIYLYGGEGDLYLNQDLYYYDVSSEKWYKITNIEIPPARKHACMICDFPRLYILGGITVNGYVAEIWEIDMEALTLRLLSKGDDDRGVPPFAYSQCSGEYENGSLQIYIMHGETLAEKPLDKYYIYSLATDSWTIHDTTRLMSRSAIMKINEHIILVGGENWGLFGFRNVYDIHFKEGTESYLGDIPEKMYATAFVYYKSAMYVHGGGDSLGKKFRSAVPIGSFIIVEFNENCSDCHFECSKGTSKSSNNTCTPCKPGTYSDDFDSLCKLCPTGTASVYYGNASLRQCKPCSEGYYAPLEGSERCYQCPTNYYCEVGSFSPNRDSLITLSTKSVQPASYAINKEVLRTLSLTMEILIASFGVIVFCLFILLHKKKSCFSHFDIFKKNHNHFVDEIMYIRKKPIGGLFSLWYVFFAMFFIVISFATYFVDNIDETKALVPLVAVEDEYDRISGDFNITTTFQNFRVTCGEDSVCKSFVSVTVEQISGAYETSCSHIYSDCIITTSCFDCSIQTGSKVKYVLLDAYSFATAVAVNVTSTSSIPDELSSIEQAIEAVENSVFRGPEASQIFFEITPSVRSKQIFSTEEDPNAEDKTGFHVAATKASVSGSQVKVEE